MTKYDDALMVKIFNEDCVNPKNKIPDESVSLGIFDPPFGLGESSFDKHYNRNSDNVIEGYCEAPDDYDKWSNSWMSEAKRILCNNGSMYVFIGHTNLRHVLNAAHNLQLNLINHIIWKYNFGVYTKNKYVTSHYHVLYYGKSKERIFNTNCRFGSQEKKDNNRSLLYEDLEDVFCINKEYCPGEKKNQNKLPEELIKKLVLYSSNPGDMVCDFFMGNFTTAYVSLKLGRNVCGYEINNNLYNHHIDKINNIEFGCELKNLKIVSNIVPENQGKKINAEEINSIKFDFEEMILLGLKKREAVLKLQNKYGRGMFSIINILKK